MFGTRRPRLYYNPFPDWIIFLIIALPMLIMTLWTGLASTPRSFALRFAVVSCIAMIPVGLLSQIFVDPWIILGLAGGLLAFILFVSGVIYLLWNAE